MYIYNIISQKGILVNPLIVINSFPFPFHNLILYPCKNFELDLCRFMKMNFYGSMLLFECIQKLRFVPLDEVLT